ncbi:MAG: N-acetyltransferase, partial [Parafilimonas terrae]|nr:N-acetyltransferase [Parafilimonas terrae]
MDAHAFTQLAVSFVPAVASSLKVIESPFRLRDERSGDVLAREALLDAAFGAGRLAKTSERLREGRLPAEGLSFVATVDGEVAGTLRFWHIEAGCQPVLLLGPLAVAARHRSLGLGGALMRHGLARAKKFGHEAVILVGDAPYYGRFGFTRLPEGKLRMPGPVDPARFVGLDLVPGTLARAEGRIVGTGLIVERR